MIEKNSRVERLLGVLEHSIATLSELSTIQQVEGDREMIRMTTRFVLIVALAVFAGCSSSTDSSPNAPPLGGDAGGPGDKVADAMGKLSAEDRAAAEKQKKCPVDDVQLGTMGVPVKVNVKETDAFVCCAACEKKLKENPDQYMSKIK